MKASIYILTLAIFYEITRSPTKQPETPPKPKEKKENEEKNEHLKIHKDIHTVKLIAASRQNKELKAALLQDSMHRTLIEL